MVDDLFTANRLSSWDNKALSTSYNATRPIQNISSISMSPTSNYVVPFSRYHSHPPSQYDIDGRQAQQAHSQSQAVETFQPNQTNPTTTK